MDTTQVASFLPEWLQPYLTPEQLTSLGTSALTALITFIVGWMIAGWVGGFATSALKRANIDEALARFLGSMVRYTFIFATLIATAEAVGIETTSLMAIFASAGLAVGLALQGSLSNFAAGVMILFFRPFTIGDVITAGGVTAQVKEIGLFATELMMLDGTKAIVPNGGLTGGTISNHTVLNKRRASVAIGVDYGADLAQVRAALTRAAEAVPQILPGEDGKKQFAVYFADFGASSLDWYVHCWSTAADFLAMQEALRTNIYNELNREGIGIPFPQLDVHFDAGALDGVKQG